MPSNTYKIPRKGPSVGLFEILEKFLRIDQSLAEVIHVKYLPQILFVAALSVIYIGNRHFADKKIRNISHLEAQVNDLRADYITLKEEVMFASKQSEIAKEAKRLGLKESKEFPFKIAIEK